MGTIIKSVAFENFYNYYGSYEANEYKFKAGINIVNADNNMGKSKFYNGFMWMLRDQVYDSDIKAFVDANESLVKMASGKAKAEDPLFKVGFRVIFTNGEVEYTIEKYSDFSTSDGELLHTPSLMSVLKKKTMQTHRYLIETNRWISSTRCLFHYLFVIMRCCKVSLWIVW